ncbi:MAG: SDR family NAD(P)-dependent oxidoreductase [Spirochaetota bacterium]|jgi:sorbitol-6-phosphate 2-dehydrogenase|nr:SDR family NAD(P)-dependent oxidoreductase [Spirochaetota bacterium]
MNIIINPSSLAPIVRGFVLSLADYSCMVQSVEAAFFHAGEPVFHSAHSDELSLIIDGLASGANMDDGLVASLLKKALEPFAARIREGLAKGKIDLSISNAKGESIAQYQLVPLAPLDSRVRLSVHRPGDPSLLSSSARSEVVKGKISFVTGGAQGFGAEIARGLALSGAIVWIADINLPGAERFARELSEEIGNQRVFPVEIDVSKEESVQKAFEIVAQTCGGLDLVVSNAGILKAGSVLEQPAKEFRLVNEINYIGFFNVAQQAARLLHLQWLGAPDWYSDIIQINSKSGLEGSNKNAAYAGSKFGGIGLVQSFALELIEYRIKVNAICPGNFFEGPLWSDPQKGLFVQYLNSGKVPGAKTIEDVRAYYEAKIPMRRGCYGQDVLRAIYYLVEQVYETGQALPVTGGQVMLN